MRECRGHVMTPIRNTKNHQKILNIHYFNNAHFFRNPVQIPLYLKNIIFDRIHALLPTPFMCSCVMSIKMIFQNN